MLKEALAANTIGGKVDVETPAAPHGKRRGRRRPAGRGSGHVADDDRRARRAFSTRPQADRRTLARRSTPEARLEHPPASPDPSGMTLTAFLAAVTRQARRSSVRPAIPSAHLLACLSYGSSRQTAARSVLHSIWSVMRHVSCRIRTAVSRYSISSSSISNTSVPLRTACADLVRERVRDPETCLLADGHQLHALQSSPLITRHREGTRSPAGRAAPSCRTSCRRSSSPSSCTVTVLLCVRMRPAVTRLEHL